MWSILLGTAVALAGKDLGNTRGEARGAPRAEGPAWETKLYALPVVGGTVFTSGGTTTTAASLGAEAGLRYWQTRRETPRWRGVARVAGSYVLTSGDASGMEARVGNFLGPTWSHLGLQTGPDLFWNRYTYGGVSLDPTVGLAWPLTASAWTGGVDVYGGIEPAWLTNEDRRVDWSSVDVPGFGHEFTYRAGLGLDLGELALTLGYSYRITAGGGAHGLSVGVRI